MPWTVDEIETEWMGGQRLISPADEVVRAFAAAEEARGREWVLRHLPSDVRLRGPWNMEPVLWFGIRVQALAAAKGNKAMLERLRRGDTATESELTAIWLLRGHHPNIELAVEQKVASRDWNRLPDFAIRDGGAPWVHVEVTALHTSLAFGRAQGLLDRIASAVMNVEMPFILEIVLRRSLTEPEEQELIRHAVDACQLDEGTRRVVDAFACLIVKSGDALTMVPTVSQGHSTSRLGLAKAIGGPLKRQVIVRVPFADQRAEAVLTKEARQLPPQECGLVMVDVTGQSTAWESWPKLIPPRFTPSRHTRIGGVVLFSVPIVPTVDGARRVPWIRLMPNPHARIALPKWLADQIEKLRGEHRRLTGQSH